MMLSPTRVFIVDDHPLVREWLMALLHQTEDLIVSGQAEGVREGVAAMLLDPPDVAIVDLSLKNSSGLDLIAELADQLPVVRVVVLSMHEETFYAERALRAGARGYVMKRESTEQIVEAIREVCAGRLYASPALLGRLAERMVGRPVIGSVETLSNRELDVFRRLGNGHSTRRIAEELNVSIKTIQAYCARIKEKLSYADASELVRDAVRWVDREQSTK
ncbi:MAG: response regulator transcription factor [Verrucomicrobia bacterium]|nr:response regulator transcription factor [Verrucomicrobiota bacterium]